MPDNPHRRATSASLGMRFVITGATATPNKQPSWPMNTSTPLESRRNEKERRNKSKKRADHDHEHGHEEGEEDEEEPQVEATVPQGNSVAGNGLSPGGTAANSAPNTRAGLFL
ncbi:hypothetical protein EAI_07521 [Harpegnathos saltator]|uniref:Uncharacterized protein n=1 Tax=Harpegnathos saltator TaxID=610380 RepID=E2C115_HARSA|nr:hypothetical protein EAI_07521 [Harpegnathos saltator]